MADKNFEMIKEAHQAIGVWRNSLPTLKANAQRLLRQAPER